MDIDTNDSSTHRQPAPKQEPLETPIVNESVLSYDDEIIGSALMDSLRDVPDPVSTSIPRGKKNPIITLDSIKKELHHECELCGKRFRKTVDYYQHKITHREPLNCDMCSERFFKPWDLTKHQMEKHSGSTMPKCEVCNKTFTEHWRLLRHVRTHSDEKKFKCDICDKAFSESGNLGKHKKQVHSKYRPFKCDVCDKSYPQKKDLQGHMIVHTVKRFSCPSCNEKFSQIEEKRAHVKAVHRNKSKEKTFSCVLCNIVFNSKTKYSNHCLTHEERNFQCRHCSKRFHTIPRLRKHVRSHRVEEHSRCVICDKSFSQDCNMKRHIEVMHMRDGRLFCLHCSQTFAQADELRVHRETEHMNERPYKCSFCEKDFFHLQSLANHIKCHSNPDRHLKEFIKPIKRLRKSSQKLIGFVADGENTTLTGEPSNQLKPVHAKRKTRSKKSPTTATAISNACGISSVNDGQSVEECLLEPLHVKKGGRPRKSAVTATRTSGQLVDKSKAPLMMQQSFQLINTVQIEKNSAEGYISATACTEPDSAIGKISNVTEIKQEDLIEIGPTVISES